MKNESQQHSSNINSKLPAEKYELCTGMHKGVLEYTGVYQGTLGCIAMNQGELKYTWDVLECNRAYKVPQGEVEYT